jgi:hypothetical protein
MFRNLPKVRAGLAVNRLEPAAPELEWAKAHTAKLGARSEQSYLASMQGPVLLK